MRYISLNYDIKQPYLCDIIADKIPDDVVNRIIDCRGEIVGFVIHLAVPFSSFDKVKEIIAEKWTFDSLIGPILAQNKVEIRLIDRSRIQDSVIYHFEDGHIYSLPH